MTTQREWFVSQGIALFLVMFGALCMGVSSHMKWSELNTAGAGIIGAGINAITSQIKQTLNNKDGGLITVNNDPPKETT